MTTNSDDLLSGVPEEIYNSAWGRDAIARIRELEGNVMQKRPFSDKLAQVVIDGQVKELDRLTELVKAERKAREEAEADAIVARKEYYYSHATPMYDELTKRAEALQARLAQVERERDQWKEQNAENFTKWRDAQAAVYNLSYPSINAQLLRCVAIEIECASGICKEYYESDTGYHDCCTRMRGEFCGRDAAFSLRDIAEAFERCEAIRALAPTESAAK